MRPVSRENNENAVATYNLNYVFRLVDNFSGGALALSAAMGRITAATNRMTAAGLAAAAAGLGFASAMAEGIASAGKFEKAMGSVRRAANLSRADMNKYGDDALDISVRTGRTAEDVAAIMTNVALQGIRDRDLLRTMTEFAAQASVVFDGLDAKSVATSIGTISSAFFRSQGVEEMTGSLARFADAFNEVSNRSNFAAGELFKFFDRAGPAAQQLGLTAEQAAAFGGAALATGVKSGQLQGTRAEATFRTLRRLAAVPSSEQSAGLRMVGLTKDSWGAMLRNDPQEAILALMRRLRAMDPILRGAAVQRLFNRSAPQFNAMMESYNEYLRQLAIVDDKWAKIAAEDPAFMEWLKKQGGQKDLYDQLARDKKVVSRVGSFAREYAQALDLYETSVARRQASFEKLQKTFWRPYLPSFTAANDWMTGIIDRLGTGLRDNPALGQAVGYGLGASLAASIAAGLTAGLATKGGILAALLVGGTIGGLTLAVTVSLVGAGAWLFLNWDSVMAKLAAPFKLQFEWPKAPWWFTSLMGHILGEDPAKLDKEGIFFKNAAPASGSENPNLPKPWGANRHPAWRLLPAIDPSAAAAAVAAVEAASRAAVGNPFKQFPMVPDYNLDYLRPRGLDRDYGPWGAGGASRATLDGAQLAASIPQSVAVSVTSDVKLTAGSMAVTYNGPITGPANVPVSGEASRGTSTATVGGGAPGSLGGMGVP